VKKFRDPEELQTCKAEVRLGGSKIERGKQEDYEGCEHPGKEGEDQNKKKLPKE